MVEWNAFELFEALLKDFDAALLTSKDVAQDTIFSLPIAIAKEGFKRFQVVAR